jgi:nitrous oxide reductase accessory protein NosL
MKKKLLLSALALTLLLASCAQPAATPTAEPESTPYDDIARGVYPGEVWQEATTPEQLGWSSASMRPRVR